MIVLSSFICCLRTWTKLNRVKYVANGTRAILLLLASVQTTQLQQQQKHKPEIQFTFFPILQSLFNFSIVLVRIFLFCFIVDRFVSYGTLHWLDSATICLHYSLGCTVYLTPSTLPLLSTPFTRSCWTLSIRFSMIFFSVAIHVVVVVRSTSTHTHTPFHLK